MKDYTSIESPTSCFIVAVFVIYIIYLIINELSSGKKKRSIKGGSWGMKKQIDSQ